MKKKLSIVYLVLIFGILYIPILTLILFSFNSANSTANFEGFSLRWYIELFNSPDAFEALRHVLPHQHPQYVEDGVNPGIGFDEYGNIYLDNNDQFPVLMGGWSWKNSENNIIYSVTDPLNIIFE